MGMVVRTNMAAINANNQLANASKAQQNGMQKLASGIKINAAKDDASGLAISEKMKNQIKALDTAKDNCEDGANMIQTAEGYMKETHDILTRMTELAEKAANGLLKDEDRGALQNEMDQLCGEIDRMASTANFNGVKLMDGSLGSKMQVTVTSTADGGIKYEGPVTEISKNNINGGIAKFTSTASYDDGTVFSVSTAALTSSSISSNGNGIGKVAVTLAYVSSGNNAVTDVKVDIEVQDGDIVTIDKDGNGTTASGGFKFTGATGSVGGTFKYDKESDQWKSTTVSGAYISGATVRLSANVTSANASGKPDKVVFDKNAAKVYDQQDANGKDVGYKDGKNGINLQIGESSTTADRLNVSINSFHTDSLFGGLKGFVNNSNDSTDKHASAMVKIKETNDSSTYNKAVSINIEDKDSASAAADAIRQISSYVSDERGKLGAQQNRLDHTVNNLATASENTTAAKSRILDTDMAKEMMEYTSKNVIAQAAQSMLAQANSQPQNVLSLLQ